MSDEAAARRAFSQQEEDLARIAELATMRAMLRLAVVTEWGIRVPVEERLSDLRNRVESEKSTP